MRLRLAKTAKADGQTIRQYAEVEQPEVWSPPQKYISQSTEIDSLVMLLIRQRTALKKTSFLASNTKQVILNS